MVGRRIMSVALPWSQPWEPGAVGLMQRGNPWSGVEYLGYNNYIDTIIMKSENWNFLKYGRMGKCNPFIQNTIYRTM